MIVVKPDNDSGDFLSHDMKPVQNKVDLRVEINLDIANTIPSI